MIRQQDEDVQDPPRLHGSAATPESLRSALAAARVDGPDARRLALIASQLPILGAGIATGVGAGSAAAATSGLSGLMIAVLAALLTGGGIAGYLATRPTPLENTVQNTPGPVPAAPTQAVVVPGSLAPPAPKPVAEPRATAHDTFIRRPRPNRSPTPAPLPLSAPAPGDVAGEIRLLQSAKAALADRPAETIQLVNDHTRHFPSGILVQEREVIAIEALLRTGKTADAHARAQSFMKTYPKSAHRRRVAALLEGGH